MNPLVLNPISLSNAGNGLAIRIAVWQMFDDIWLLAARNFSLSNYSTISDFVDDIRANNPAVQNWRRVATGSTIAIPILGGAG